LGGERTPPSAGPHPCVAARAPPGGRSTDQADDCRCTRHRPAAKAQTRRTTVAARAPPGGQRHRPGGRRRSGSRAVCPVERVEFFRSPTGGFTVRGGATHVATAKADKPGPRRVAECACRTASRRVLARAEGPWGGGLLHETPEQPRTAADSCGQRPQCEAPPLCRAAVCNAQCDHGRGRCLRPVVGAWRPAHLGRRRRSCGGVWDSFLRNSRTRLRCKGAPRNRRRLRGRNHSFTYSLLVEVRTKNGRRRER